MIHVLNHNYNLQQMLAEYASSRRVKAYNARNAQDFLVADDCTEAAKSALRVRKYLRSVKEDWDVNDVDWETIIDAAEYQYTLSKNIIEFLGYTTVYWGKKLKFADVVLKWAKDTLEVLEDCEVV